MSPVEVDFFDLMPTALVFNKRSSTDAYGNYSYGPDIRVENCRLDDLSMGRGVDAPGMSYITDPSITRGAVFVDTGYDFDVFTKITLPNGHVVTVTDAQTVYDEVGQHHQMLAYEEARS